MCIIHADHDMELKESGVETEQALLERCRAGDGQAFGMVVRKYMRQAYFTALGLLGNHADALDVSQEAFVKAHGAMGRFDASKPFFTWYYRILRNLCLNHLRDSAKHRHLRLSGENAAGEEMEMPLPAAAGDPSVLLERSELMEELWRAMSQLAPEEREVILLREIEGCTYGEISERLEIPRGTVMSRLFYARERLRKKLGGKL